VAKPAVRRCAIYTRKSSEEGLEQEYNSLDAQRDAAEAFVRSQKHEGWKALRDAYDDGGISGGHLERPGLQRLLQDIRAGKIDIVIVYKVDRLSRSLADFAQLMQLFDKHEVSFVSVTQQFNTSTSMGRLTLNVLLSFAQFEREVTGERIRDKIADWVPEVPQSPLPLASQEPPQIQIEGGTVVITANVSFARRRGEVRLVDAQTGALLEVQQSSPNPVLIQALVQAEYWRSQLQKDPSKCLGEVVEPHGVSANYARRLINAAYLAPEIKRAIFQGTQPVELQVQDLIKPRSMDWEVQKRELGLHRPAAGALH